MRKALSIAFLLALAASAFGQSPPFPQSLPGNTVVGRISPVAGPANAVSLNALASVLGITSSVTGCGAKGDGSTDDTVAIQACINNLPATGGDVIFPCGNYKITSTLSIGNGSSSAASTRYGVRLKGAGLNQADGFFTGFPTTACVTLTYAGALHGTMLQINGPLQGWGVENIAFDGASLADLGLNIISGQFGDSANLLFKNINATALQSTAYSPFSGVGNADSFANVFRGVAVNVPATSGAKGIVLTGQGTTANTDYNVFYSVAINLGSAANFGIYLQAADSNQFYGVHLFGGGGSSAGLTLDYSVNNVWPASNGFYGIDPKIATGVLYQNSGSPGGGATPNWIYGLITTNGATNPNIANLSFISPNVSFAGVAGKTLTTNNSLTLAGTDGKTLTVNNSATIAGGDGSTLAVAANKTLTASNSLTLAGTDSTTMTFPSTSSTIPSINQVGFLNFRLTGVNFNSANTDNSVAITLPPGVSRYAISSVRLTNASASISTATVGVFTGAGGTGQTIAASQVISVTQSATDTNANTQALTITNQSSEAYNDATIFVRVGTAQGSAATADVVITIVPLT